MDPLTGIGAAASIVQLLTLCANASKAARDLWNSYADAPTWSSRFTISARTSQQRSLTKFFPHATVQLSPPCCKIMPGSCKDSSILQQDLKSFQHVVLAAIQDGRPRAREVNQTSFDDSHVHWSPPVNSITTQQTRVYGSDLESIRWEHPTSQGFWQVVLKKQKKRQQRRFRATGRVWLYLFGPRVVEFEFGLFAHVKSSLSPMVSFGIKIRNSRPMDSMVFQACSYGDLKRVRLLLESGDAGINDICEDSGMTLVHLIRRPTYGLPSCARLLLRAGAEFYTEPTKTRPSSMPILPLTQPEGFRSGLEILQAEGLVVPRRGPTAPSESLMGNLLSSAISAGRLQDIMTIIDSFEDPSPHLKDLLHRSTFHRGRIEVVALLMKLGLHPDWHDPRRDDVEIMHRPIMSATENSSSGLAPIHYYLFRGACPGPFNGIYYVDLSPSFPVSAWQILFKRFVMFPSHTRRFQELEGILLHLLLHECSDLPYRELIAMNFRGPSKRCHQIVRITCEVADAARIWSVHDGPESLRSLITVLETDLLLQHRLATRPMVDWSSEGVIETPARRWDPSEDNIKYPERYYQYLDGYEGILCEKRWDSSKGQYYNFRKDLGLPPLDGPPGICTGADYPHSTRKSSPHYQQFFRMEDDGRREIPFDRTTLFYENISTEDGRRQMKQFPIVRALCNALQLAGYRVEMGRHDGEIWFEDDDGDPYHDAMEFQPAPGVDDGVVANCPICRDPQKYGLDYILERAKVGEDFLDEWRDKQRRKATSRDARF
ncbi:hypothetical protein QBC40DRAFT_317318 [Triangularia verruculosa]|uniref:Ankyrin repeat protein n=1 Tax=Triangularia verruculosa TaxID=2587418 RepID=A0AAN6XMF2_9PEZI|nr:hypothetical protein QBC40DRAFT_317318 [Triangularia verruculosa]